VKTVLWKICQAFCVRYGSLSIHSTALPSQNTPTNLAGFHPGFGILKIERKIKKGPPGAALSYWHATLTSRSRAWPLLSAEKPMAAALTTRPHTATTLPYPLPRISLPVRECSIPALECRIPGLQPGIGVHESRTPAVAPTASARITSPLRIHQCGIRRPQCSIQNRFQMSCFQSFATAPDGLSLQLTENKGTSFQEK
jgi:hypothetical protein